MADEKSLDLTKTTATVATVMAAFAVIGTLFAGPFGAAIGAGIGAIVSGAAVIVQAVKEKRKNAQR